MNRSCLLGALVLVAMMTFGTLAAQPPNGAARTLPAAEPWQPELAATLPAYIPAQRRWQRELTGSAPPIMPALVQAWIAGYRQHQPGVTFQLGSGWFPPQGRLNAHLREFLTGQRDFAFISRELSNADRDTFVQYHGHPPLEIPVAMGSWRHFGFVDTLAFIVNAENPLRALSLAQVDAIFSATRLRGHPQVQHWGDLGVPEWEQMPVHIVGASAWQGAESARALSARKAVFDLGEQLGQWRFDLAASGSEADIPAQVAADPYAIGFTGLGHLIPGVRALALSIAPDGAPIAPDHAEVASGAYPLSRRLYLLIDAPPGQPADPLLADFARYLTSRDGQQIVLDQGIFLPLREEPPIPTPRPALIPPDAPYLSAQGKVRVVGYNDMDEMLHALGDLFSARHPGIQFEWDLKGTRSAPAPLMDGTSAFAPMGAELEPDALARWHATYSHPPLAIPIAHDSLTPGALSSPTGIFVHAGNPLHRISVETLRRVVAPLPHESRLTHWRELGITGVLAGQPIRVIALADDTAIGALMLRRMQAGRYVDELLALRQSRDVAAALASAPDGLGIANLNHARPGIRALSITGHNGQEIAATQTGIQSGAYPFDRHLLIHVRRDAQGQVEPLAHAFLCLALSTEGQQTIARGTRGYLALNPKEIETARRAIGGCPP